MSAAKIVVYSCDVQTGLARRFENSMEVMGLPSSGPKQRCSECISPEDRPHYDNASESITPQASRFEVEYRVRHAVTGVQFWVLDRGEGEFDETGKLRHVHGAIVDISKHINAEIQKREASQPHSVAFAAASMGAWHLTTEPGQCLASRTRLASLRAPGSAPAPPTTEETHDDT